MLSQLRRCWSLWYRKYEFTVQGHGTDRLLLPQFCLLLFPTHLLDFSSMQFSIVSMPTCKRSAAVLLILHKGVVRQFKLGDDSRLIQSGIINCRPDNFCKNFNYSISREENKTIYSGLRIAGMALSNLSDRTWFFCLRQVNLYDFENPVRWLWQLRKKDFPAQKFWKVTCREWIYSERWLTKNGQIPEDDLPDLVIVPARRFVSTHGPSSVANLNGLLHSLEYGWEYEDIFGLLLAGSMPVTAQRSHINQRDSKRYAGQVVFFILFYGMADLHRNILPLFSSFHQLSHTQVFTDNLRVFLGHCCLPLVPNCTIFTPMLEFYNNVWGLGTE